MDTRSPGYAVRSWLLLPVACLALAAAPAPVPAGNGAKPDAKTAAATDAKSAAASDAKVDLKLLTKGAMPKLGGYRPQQLKLSEKKPVALKKAPELKSPIYGEIRFGGKSFVVALDEPKDADAKLYVDANGNGDLTDDPDTTWNKGTYQGPGGAELVRYSGSIQLPLKGGGAGELVTLGAYRFDDNDPQRKQLKNTLLYYSDYAYEGEVTLAGKAYHALLADANATGEFAAGAKAGANNAAVLCVDVNGDGSFSQPAEVFESSKPFNIKGTTWAVAAPGGDGAPIAIAKSDQKVAEIPMPPGVGEKAIAFSARRMDGKSVNFPADYKGKIVMLDFWATWCGPCMAEVDGLVSAYNEYHPRGVEILGISLDQPKSADRVKQVTGEKGMTWPQVYDGKFWQAAVAQKYGINSIPSAFLVDGDTGAILAAGGSLRGDNLAETLKKAVEKKGASPDAQTAKSEQPKQDKEQAKDDAKAKDDTKAGPTPESPKPAGAPAAGNEPPF